MSSEIVSALAAVIGASLSGSITVATLPTVVSTTVPASGLLGLLGFTTTASTVVAAPVTVPAGAIIAVGALLVYGGMQAYKHLKVQELH